MRARAFALSLVLVVPFSALSGDATPQGVADYRHQVFESLGKHMKASAMIVKGKVDAPADLPNHARAMNEMAKLIPTMFPDGTGPDAVKTEAKAEIWTKRADFDAQAQAFVAATSNFAEVAETGDAEAIKAAFGEVGKSCGKCHDAFRVEDKP